MNHGPPVHRNSVTAMLANYALIVFVRAEVFLLDRRVKDSGEKFALPIVSCSDASLRADPKDKHLFESKSTVELGRNGKIER